MSEPTPAEQIRITAEPQVIPTNCLFRVDRSLSVTTLYTSDPTWAQEWMPLAAALFAADADVRGVRVADAEVLISLAAVPKDWRETARTLGSALRNHLQAGGVVAKEGAADAMVGDDLVRQQAQTIIDRDLNPSLASHGGWVEIQASRGPDLYITMGGGCQGCGSAAMTMKQGVEVALRNGVPGIGAIHDATDHAAGANPYM